MDVELWMPQGVVDPVCTQTHGINVVGLCTLVPVHQALVIMKVGYST